MSNTTTNNVPAPTPNPFRTVSKAIGGGIGAVLAGNGTLLVMPPEVALSMPWYGYLGYNLVVFAVGFLVPYLFPKNATA